MINYIYLLIYTLIKITIKIKMFDLFDIKKREKQKKNLGDDVMGLLAGFRCLLTILHMKTGFN